MNPPAAVKQLLVELSMNWICLGSSLCILELSFISVTALPKHSFDTCETSSDIFIFASSRFAGPEFCFPRLSCACSRTACRYFPWASIRSCRCRCTCCHFNFRAILEEAQRSKRSNEDLEYSISFFFGWHERVVADA